MLVFRGCGVGLGLLGLLVGRWLWREGCGKHRGPALLQAPHAAPEHTHTHTYMRQDVSQLHARILEHLAAIDELCEVRKREGEAEGLRRAREPKCAREMRRRAE